MPRSFKIVVVCWLDAWKSDTDETHAPVPLVVVGHLLQSDKDGIRLAMEIGEQANHTRDVRFIPRCNVVSERVIFNSNARKRR